MVAHCPLSVDGAADACYESGASHVVLNDTLAALNGLHESEFDVVIDTIGGRRSECQKCAVCSVTSQRVWTNMS